MKFFCLAALVFGVALGSWADTLILADGTAFVGELVGVDAEELYFLTQEGVELAVAWDRAREVEIDWGLNPEPRLEYAEWLSAIRVARRELSRCRRSKQGLVLGGLLFMAGGWWLTTQNYGLFGELLIGLGAVAGLLGISSPAPSCPPLLHRVALLTEIGLEHGWFY